MPTLEVAYEHATKLRKTIRGVDHRDHRGHKYDRAASRGFRFETEFVHLKPRSGFPTPPRPSPVLETY
jgi:hypothetical protein